MPPSDNLDPLNPDPELDPLAQAAPESSQPPEPTPVDRPGPIGTAISSAKKHDFFDAGDTALAIPRGIAGAGLGLYNLAKAVTGDRLPEIKNPFGESTSTTGSVLEGLTQFATGFIPIGGFLEAGAVAKALGTAKALDTATEGASLFSEAQSAWRNGALWGSAVKRNVLASGATAFAVFDGHQQRLSNLVEAIPGLHNPVTEFLSAKKEDSEIVGRLKNALDQAGAAFFLDALVLGLKGQKAAQKVIDAGGTAEEASVAQKAAAPPEEMKAALEKAEAQGPPSPFDENGDPLGYDVGAALEKERLKTNQDILSSKGYATGDPRFVAPIKGATAEEMADFDRLAKERYPDLSPRDAGFKYAMDAEKDTEAATRAAGTGTEPFPPEEQKIRDLLANDPNFARHYKANMRQEIPAEGGPVPTPEGVTVTPKGMSTEPPASIALPEPTSVAAGIDSGAPIIGLTKPAVDALKAKLADAGVAAASNPRNLSASEIVASGIQPKDLNLSHWVDGEDSALIMRGIEQFTLPAAREDLKNLGVKTYTEQTTAAMRGVADILGMSDKDYLALQSRNTQDLERIGSQVNSAAIYLRARGSMHNDLMDAAMNIKSGAAQGDLNVALAQELKNLDFLKTGRLQLSGQKAEYGRTLGSFNMDVGGIKLPKSMHPLANDPVEAAKLVEAAGGSDAVLARIKQMKMAYGDGGDAGMAAMYDIATQSKLNVAGKVTGELIRSNLLGPKSGFLKASMDLANTVLTPLQGLLGGAMRATYDQGKAIVQGTASQGFINHPSVKPWLNMVDELANAGPYSMRLLKKAAAGQDIGVGNGGGFLDSFNRAPAISASNLGVNDSVAAAIVNTSGKLIRAPMTLISKISDFATNVNAYARARALLRDKASSMNISGTENVTSFVNDQMNLMVHDTQWQSSRSVMQQAVTEADKMEFVDEAARQRFIGEFVNKNFPADVSAVSDAAREYGSKVTFSTKGRPPGVDKNGDPTSPDLSWSIQQMIRNHPMLMPVMPFVNTPSRLIGWTGEQLNATGLARYMLEKKVGTPQFESWMGTTQNKFYTEMMSGDPARKALAVGRLATGAGMVATAMSAAAAGTITGHGPTNKQERDALLATGWLPYAIRTSKGYVQYNRLEPFATIIGLTADTYELGQHHIQDEQQPWLTAYMHGIGASIGDNITSKTYLEGAKNFLDVLSDPDKNLSTFINRTATSFLIPNSVRSAAAASNPDAEMPDLQGDQTGLRGMLRAMQASIPGASESLPPQRNILGEPIKRLQGLGSDVLGSWTSYFMPVAYRETKDNLITSELSSLAYPFSPSRRNINGLDLTQVPVGETNAYDRFTELQGQVAIRGRTLQDALRERILSPKYQAMTPHIVDDNISPRAEVLNDIIQQYRRAAWQKLLSENSTLQQYDQTYTVNKHILRQGGRARPLPSIIPGG